jgi:hypothetical protein
MKSPEPQKIQPSLDLKEPLKIYVLIFGNIKIW